MAGGQEQLVQFWLIPRDGYDTNKWLGYDLSMISTFVAISDGYSQELASLTRLSIQWYTVTCIRTFGCDSCGF